MTKKDHEDISRIYLRNEIQDLQKRLHDLGIDLTHLSKDVSILRQTFKIETDLGLLEDKLEDLVKDLIEIHDELQEEI